MKSFRRAAAWAGFALLALMLACGGLIVWPKPLFAYSLATGKVVLASDRPIPATAGDRMLRDCERLLERSPLRPEGARYRLYIANEQWRRRIYFFRHAAALGVSYYYGLGGSAFLSGADFATGRLVHRGYLAPPPRTLAYFCAHELTHIVTGEHVGVVNLLRMPEWVREGIADYVAIENRESFEQLRQSLGDRPVDPLMMQTYGSYPRYRLLVTYFIEKQGWSVAQLLNTRLSFDEALALMRDGDTARSARPG